MNNGKTGVVTVVNNFGNPKLRRFGITETLITYLVIDAVLTSGQAGKKHEKTGR